MASTVDVVVSAKDDPTMRPCETRNDDHDVDFRRRVLNAVDSLPIEHVLAVWLVDTCSLSYVDAAHVAQRQPENIQELVHHARHQIRTHLGGHMPSMQPTSRIRRRRSQRPIPSRSSGSRCPEQ